MDTELIRLLTGPGGLLVALLVILFTGMKKKWVFSWYVKEIKEDRDEWKTAALRGTRIAERVVTVHEADTAATAKKEESEDARA